MALSAKNCVACKSEEKALTASEAEAMLKEVAGWKLEDGGKWLVREFKFKNFKTAIAFANNVGEICEQEGHHADFALGWGYCNLRLQTHDIGGLHQNDFIVAAKINEIPL